MLDQSDISKFQRYIYHFYRHYGRHDLPWRQNHDPYHILVSEMMLQQTQVDRVIPKFTAFLEYFPTVEKLAQASVAEVISAWQGLGYNRRGLNLQRAAQHIFTHFHGQVPTSTEELISLPGIGPYTAAAIQAFAFNKPSLVIETNIRAVYLFHFFHGAYNVEDSQLLPLIEQTLDRQNPRKWYSALMDYGTHLKQVLPNPTQRSKTYVKQSTFAGSNRQLRGQIVRLLTQHTQLTATALCQATEQQSARLTPLLDQLIQEGFITQSGRSFQLATKLDQK